MEISRQCGMVWASFTREKVSNSKKLYGQNDDRFYNGRKIFKKHKVSILTKKGGNINQPVRHP